MFKNILFFFLFATCSIANSQTPAFPGAEGGGMYTTGGRGGNVLYVTSLADAEDISGTLRWALKQNGPKTIVFKIGGIIDLRSELKINKGDVTIAGQTAPGDGICIKGYPFVISADNVIVRFLRFRMGDLNAVQDDAIKANNRKNVIIDHCSMSWSTDECASFYDNENFTLQWCLISESLRSSVHKKGVHGYGGIWGGKSASFHHNLLAHHDSRNPRFNGYKRAGLKYRNALDEERVDFRNNVIYNWGSNSSYGGESGKYNLVANYFKAGPASKKSARNRITGIDLDENPAICPPGYGKYYIQDNYVFGYPEVIKNNWLGVSFAEGIHMDSCKSLIPFKYAAVKNQTAKVAFEKVLAYSGASLNRDVIDKRISNEVKTGTTTFKGSVSGIAGLIDSQSDVGGWPVYNTSNAAIDDNSDGIPNGWLEKNHPGKTANDIDKNGFTYLEIYLNSLVESITERQNPTRFKCKF